MNQFDEKIRKKLARGPDRIPDPSLWAKIVLGMTGPSSYKNNGWMQSASGLALLLVIGLASFWFGRNSVVNNSPESEELLMVSTAKQFQTEIAPDTVVIRDTVYKYIQTASTQKSKSLIISTFSPVISDLGREIRSWRHRFLPASQVNLESLPKNQQQPSFSALDENAIITRRGFYAANKTNGLLSSADADQMQPIADNGKNAVTLPLALLQKLESDRLESKQRALSLHPYRALHREEIISVNRRRRIIDLLIPDRHRLGIVLGALNPIDREKEHVNEVVVGIQYEMRFSRTFSLMTGIRHRSYQGKSENDLDGTEYPLPTNILFSDRLEEVYVKKKFLSVPLTVKYSIPIRKRYWPYIETGILFTRVQSQDFTFEVKRSGDDEIKLKSETGAGPWLRSSYLIGVGLEYSPTYRLTTTLGIEGRYHNRLSDSEFEKTHGLGLRLGMFYNF